MKKLFNIFFLSSPVIRLRKVLFLVIIFFVFFYPFKVYSAEVLQITGISSLMIGDQNRNYIIEIPCIKEVSQDAEAEVLNLLKSELPRYSRVNLKPRGLRSGRLIADVIRLEDGIDIRDLLLEKGYIDSSC